MKLLAMSIFPHGEFDSGWVPGKPLLFLYVKSNASPPYASSKLFLASFSSISVPANYCMLSVSNVLHLYFELEHFPVLLTSISTDLNLPPLSISGSVSAYIVPSISISFIKWSPSRQEFSKPSIDSKEQALKFL